MVATYVIEIAIPPLFFAPLRRLRLFAFYCQVCLGGGGGGEGWRCKLLCALAGGTGRGGVGCVKLAGHEKR